jgi:hypothetical protein
MMNPDNVENLPEEIDNFIIQQIWHHSENYDDLGNACYEFCCDIEWMENVDNADNEQSGEVMKNYKSFWIPSFRILEASESNEDLSQN